MIYKDLGSPLQKRGLLIIRKPHVLLAFHTVIDDPFWPCPDAAIHSRHQETIAMLAEFPLELSRQPNLVLHGQASCFPYVIIGLSPVFGKDL